MNNPYIRIFNRAKYWQNKLESCADKGRIELYTASDPNKEFMDGCVKKTDRYLRHIKRLSRLAIQIENRELRNQK